MRKIVVPVVLLAIAVGALVIAHHWSSQIHSDLGTIATDDTRPAGVQTPLISTRRLTNLVAPSLITPEFTNTLENLMSEAPDTACLSVTVTERAGTVYQSGSNLLLRPSGALMLATLAVALVELGPDHTFTTSVASLVEPENGVINGDIYLIGGGDPMLFTAAYIETLQYASAGVYTPIDNLAQQLVDDGLTLVTGAVVGDASYFDELRHVPTWPEGLAAEQQVGTLLGLQFDDGWVRFPNASENQAGSQQEQTGQQLEDDLGFVAAEDPPFYAAALFDDMLEARDVIIRRSPRSEALPNETEVFMLGAIESPALGEYATQMLQNNDVEIAEMLLKEIGKHTTGQGTTRAGLEGVASTLAELGINLSEMQMLDFDGSGLDPANQTTCTLFGALLENDKLRPLFENVLADAGEPGPLQTRLDSIAATSTPRVTDPASSGRILGLAAQGTDATALLGYIDIGLGQELTFVFMANEPNAPNNSALERLQARIVAYLAELEAKPSVDDIFVLPVRIS
ncbi:MAG: D-alanyl-D-alanine carboxypeptidase [bacterium]|nr:D-alanyl-D-alanine carboxypeptidase [bacterium]